ncbi:MAG: LD-carboxypeptidase [Polyangiales bacterium]|nr:LD-carboxypeptidase [Myxococcales bacterium]MCB9657066.1 LD-carboxypeptidase [Sandaracinaceae bacterium]
MTPPLLEPPPLSIGDHVALIAPSGAFDRAAFLRGVARLEALGYRCRYDEGIFERVGYCAGDDARRADEVERALADPEVRWLVAARGGFGATRLLPRLSVDAVRRAGKGLVGFSDVTALHALWARAGVASVHGTMVAKLDALPPDALARWAGALAGASPAPFTQLTPLVHGHAEGPLRGGNLAVLAALAGTPYAPPLDDAVLFLEDVGERPYRVDRMLTTLRQAGWFARLRGVVFGAFTEAPAGPDGVETRDVLREHAEALGLPAACDAPVGHVNDNRELWLGRRVTLDATSGTLRWLPVP